MIKPCKGCGEDPIIQHRYDNTYWIYCCRHYCTNCGNIIHAETEEEGIELWNIAQEPNEIDIQEVIKVIESEYELKFS